MVDPSGSGASQSARVLVKHVLHVADQSILMRFGPAFVQVAQGLCTLGLRTALLTDDPEMRERLEGTPVECHLLRHLGGWRGWRPVRRLLSQLDPPADLVHLWGTAGLWWVRWWAGRTGVPLVVHAFGLTHVEQVVRSGVGRHHHLAIASESLAKRLLERFPLAAGRYRIVQPAIAPPVRSAPPPAGEHTFSVLCVNGTGEHREVGVLLDAVAQLRRSRCDLQVALLGVGPGASNVWRQVRRRRVQECVSLLDEPRLWEKVLPEMDACVVPACQRELSLVPLLAMGLGKIVIASRDQLAEWFIEGQTCWQFTPGSAVELAYLLTRAIEQPKHAQELSQTASAHVRAHHSVHQMIADLLALYDLASRPGVGQGDTVQVREQSRDHNA
jgi:glycosyltransferase involved in cell wall biosynthesis